MHLSKSKFLFSYPNQVRHFFRYALIFVSGLMLSACASTEKLNFTSFSDDSTESLARSVHPVTTNFNNHQLVLAAPSGFCFDTTMEQHSATGGFALIAKCRHINGATPRSGSNGVIITASVGSASPTATLPDAQQLFESYALREPNATLLEMRNSETLSLIKLREGTNTVPTGASPVHWRGVFKEENHIILLTIYAPENSRYLKAKGAHLLKDIVRASHNATQLVLATAHDSKTNTSAATVTP